MPIYEYECAPCGETMAEKRSVEERFESPECRRCGMETRLKVSTPWLAPVTRAGTGSSGLAKRGRAQALRA